MILRSGRPACGKRKRKQLLLLFQTNALFCNGSVRTTDTRQDYEYISSAAASHTTPPQQSGLDRPSFVCKLLYLIQARTVGGGRGELHMLMNESACVVRRRLLSSTAAKKSLAYVFISCLLLGPPKLLPRIAQPFCLLLPQALSHTARSPPPRSPR